METFINDNFMLRNATAKKLYHDYAKAMPIYDYHCHLNPREISEDKKFANLTELWLSGDHYKWRAMRSAGVEERYITGTASDKEKFLKWAQTLPCCIGNPIYHWAHLELKKYFGIDKLLSPKTAEEIWNSCNELLQKDEFTVRGLIKNSNVKVICTTDDPTDTLEHHISIAKDSSFDVKVLPTFRPDKSFNIERDGFIEWLGKLAVCTGRVIKTFEDLKTALTQRIDFFHEVGCRLSDHGLEPPVYIEATDEEAAEIFHKALTGYALTKTSIQKYKTQVMLFLGKQYSQRGWIMQLHVGALRNTNQRMFEFLGPDSGFDTIGDYSIVEPLANLMSRLDHTNQLPKTILYSLNPRDNEVLGTLIGCFQTGGIPGKIQLGSGWWFNDHKDGMLQQMTALSSLGLLSKFVGMLTDSRSFLSYTRHEYFRRILCSLLGEWVENGEAPDDMELLGCMVKDICFDNAKKYFGIEY